MSEPNTAAAATPLKSFVDQLEAYARQKADADAGLARVYREAKTAGYDAKVIKQLIARRAGDPAARSEEEQLLELYETALLQQGEAP